MASPWGQDMLDWGGMQCGVSGKRRRRLCLSDKNTLKCLSTAADRLRDEIRLICNENASVASFEAFMPSLILVASDTMQTNGND
jgi:hypothetical protein